MIYFSFLIDLLLLVLMKSLTHIIYICVLLRKTVGAYIY